MMFVLGLALGAGVTLAVVTYVSNPDAFCRAFREGYDRVW